MNIESLSSLLQPFLRTPLAPPQLAQFETYLQLILKWNSKMNLTAVRGAEEIVTRHFGESLFAAEVLRNSLGNRISLLDLGSGAGFPGIPIKISIPDLKVTLAESQTKKVVFLREVIRSLQLSEIDVYRDRSETLRMKFDVVTMRAVDRQTELLPQIASLTAQAGLVLLMLGSADVEPSIEALPGFAWERPKATPLSTSRVAMVGTKKGNPG